MLSPGNIFLMPFLISATLGLELSVFFLSSAESRFLFPILFLPTLAKLERLAFLSLVPCFTRLSSAAASLVLTVLSFLLQLLAISFSALGWLCSDTKLSSSSSAVSDSFCTAFLFNLRGWRPLPSCFFLRLSALMPLFHFLRESVIAAVACSGWAVLMWRLTLHLCVKVISHTVHLNLFSDPCIVFLWRQRLACHLHVKSHSLHLWTLSEW